MQSLKRISPLMLLFIAFSASGSGGHGNGIGGQGTSNRSSGGHGTGNVQRPDGAQDRQSVQQQIQQQQQQIQQQQQQIQQQQQEIEKLQQQVEGKERNGQGRSRAKVLTPEVQAQENIEYADSIKVAPVVSIDWERMSDSTTVHSIGKGRVIFTGLYLRTPVYSALPWKANVGCGRHPEVQYGAEKLKSGEAAIYNDGQVIVICR